MNQENLNTTSILDEIIATQATADNVFNTYKPKKEIAVEILKELNQRLFVINEKQKGFSLDDTPNNIGILSQCHCLQTLVSLASDFGLSFTNPRIIPEQQGTIRSMMDSVIENIFDRIRVKDAEGNVTGYMFDASPYDSAHFSEEYSNIDTITWVLTSFFLIIKYHASINEVCKWEDELVRVIRHGLRYIIDAFIYNEDPFVDGKTTQKGGLQTGWNFTKECKEPSLYFTYTVCECYLDMYNTFECFLEYLHAEKNREQYDGLISEKYDELKTEFNKQKTKYNKDKQKNLKDPLKAKHDEYNELVRVFRRINDIDESADLRIENTLYSEFEEKCKIVAQHVWKYVEKDLADQFFYNDLHDTVSEAEIRMSTTSDVLFNSAYIVNIMICSGLDETLSTEQAYLLSKGKITEAQKKQREFNNLLESCLLAVQKAIRMYESLKNSRKEYIVDQFLIGFNEDFSDHEIAVNELRKLRMRVFSLLPVLIHTNTVASEFLVKYPQHNMRKYLEYILDNRLVKDGKPHWIWEKDGFFSGSNYYYVLALNEFYAYHETYEEKYIKIGARNKEREARIQEKHEKELQKPDKTIGILKTQLELKEQELKVADEKYEALKAEKDAMRRPVEDAVAEVIKQEVEKLFPSLLCDFMKSVNETLYSDIINRNVGKENSDANRFKEMFLQFAMLMIGDRIFSTVYSARASAAQNQKDFEELSGYIKQDIKQLVGSYIGLVKNIDGHESALFEKFNK